MVDMPLGLLSTQAHEHIPSCGDTVQDVDGGIQSVVHARYRAHTDCGAEEAVVDIGGQLSSDTCLFSSTYILGHGGHSGDSVEQFTRALGNRVTITRWDLCKGPLLGAARQ